MDELKQTLRELYIGVGVCTVLFAVVGCIFASNWLSWLLGTLLGGAAAAVIRPVFAAA